MVPAPIQNLKCMWQRWETFQVGGTDDWSTPYPGHTLESSCYLWKDEAGKNNAVLQAIHYLLVMREGPTWHRKEMNSDDEWSCRYAVNDSIHNKLFLLEDEVIIYPVHGAGRSCGVRTWAKKTHSTIGEQKKYNYAPGCHQEKNL